MKNLINNRSYFSRPFQAGLFIALISFIWISCAKPISPTGGPRDEVPPEVSKTFPENQSLNFKGKEVRIFFNEPVRAPTFDKEIFISPLVKRPKIIRSDNAKRIEIKFQEDLRPQTTYVISLTEVKDNSEGNEIAEAFTLAFSTGDQLDSMQIEGKVLSPTAGQGEKDMKILLYDADSIVNNDFLGKRPAYISKTDDAGFFSFKYLRNAPYKILGLIDTDQSNTYSQPGERVAIMEDTLITFDSEDSTSLATAELYAFLPDDIAPQLRRYNWTHPNTLTLIVSENLRLDPMKLFRTDTLGQDSIALTDISLWKNGADVELLIHMPVPQENYSLLHFSFVQDSLGNSLDSVLLVGPNRSRDPENPLLKKPVLEVEKEAWEVFPYRLLLEEDEKYFSLKDTNSVDSLRKTIPLTWEKEGFRLWMKPGEEIDPEKAYKLEIDGAFFQQEDSSLMDSTFSYTLKWFDPENFGTINGRLIMNDSLYSGPVILQFMDKNKVIRSVRDTVFNWKNIPKGSYTFKIIADADSNGIWTPGSLYPVRLPEKIFQDANPISIRENWEFEDHEVKMGIALPPPPEEETTTDASGTKSPGGPGTGARTPGGRRN